MPIAGYVTEELKNWNKQKTLYWVTTHNTMHSCTDSSQTSWPKYRLDLVFGSRKWVSRRHSLSLCLEMPWLVRFNRLTCHRWDVRVNLWRWGIMSLFYCINEFYSVVLMSKHVVRLSWVCQTWVVKVASFVRLAESRPSFCLLWSRWLCAEDSLYTCLWDCD